MSGNYGRRITTDGLVFYADLKNPRSYAGEPTVNLCKYPLIEQLWTEDWGNNSSGSAEIVEGYKGIGNSIRIHHLTEDTYGRYIHYSEGFEISQGDVITISFMGRGSKDDLVLTYFYILRQGSLSNKSLPSVKFNTQWEKHTITYEYNDPETTYATFMVGFSSTNDLGWVDVTQVQIEKKPYATPFVDGERSAVDGLKNLVGDIHGDLSNMTFNENGPIFNGTDSYIRIHDFQLQQEQSFSIWIKPSDIYTSTNMPISSVRYSSSPVGHDGFRLSVTSTLDFGIWTNSETGQISNIISHPTDFNNWQNIVGTWSKRDGVMKLYVNGELRSQDDFRGYLNLHEIMDLGRYRLNGTGYFTGEIELPMIYNRALSPEEIKQNYFAHRGRYIN